MAKHAQHRQAVRLRKRGVSIGNIATKLSVSKSTVSLWCKDLPLSEKQLRKIADLTRHHATYALLKSAEFQREKRQKNILALALQGRRDVGSLTSRDIFMAGLGLYWGEGYKQGSQEMGFTNSNSQIVLFYIEWLQRIYQIKKSDLILRVTLNNLHVRREREIVRYWSKLIGVSTSQFTKSSIVRTGGAVYSHRKVGEYHGTLRIKVRRGTNLRRRVLGSIEALATK